MVNVAFLGFGTVGSALRDLLERRRDALRAGYGVEFNVTGVATRARGWMANDHEALDIHSWLRACDAHVMFESIALNHETGQPALEYSRAALEQGIHVVSANKGPVVHGYRELTAIAKRRGCAYRFESAVMDGAPIFSLVERCLPLVDITGISGVFTSTSTIVLEAIEQGATMDDGIRHAQELGIAEADPSYDVEGWDSAVKLCALANVLMAGDLRPEQVERVGLQSLDTNVVRAAARAGEPIRLVGDVRTTHAGIAARVAPRACAPNDVYGAVRGATLVTHFEAEVFPGGLTVTSRDPDPQTTAYGMLADFISVLNA